MEQVLAGHIINDEFFEFINSNIECVDASILMLQSKPLGFDKSFAATQIVCRKKCKTKIPELLSFPRFIFPTKVSSEQCTAEVVAKFHASLFYHEDAVLDMTAGLMVDDYYISHHCKSLLAIEINTEIAEIDAYNATFLGLSNVQILTEDSIEFLKRTDSFFDVIFVDPARRGSNYKRFYDFHDCSPDILSNLDLIMTKSKRLIVKGSPMLDITKSCADFLPYLSKVYVISDKNECKELLYILDFINVANDYDIEAINFDSSVQHYTLKKATKHDIVSFLYPKEQMYLYEPNSSIMKSGGFDSLCLDFGLNRMHKNTHLFLHNNNLADFPGRKFIITNIYKFKNFKQANITNADVAVRNFKLSADEL